jgi:hypothetical protein
MSKSAKSENSETGTVSSYIAKLDSTIKTPVQKIREIILDIDPSIKEHIKWNSPSFYYSGEMKAFNPKEYKRDIAVMNLTKGRIMLVLPTGSVIKDPTGLLEGDFKDGRRMINFSDLADVKAKEVRLKGVIRGWLAMVEK